MLTIKLKNNQKKNDKSPDFVGVLINRNGFQTPVFAYLEEQEGYTVISVHESKYPVKSDDFEIKLRFDKAPKNRTIKMPNYTGDFKDDEENRKMAVWLTNSNKGLKALVKIKKHIQ